MVQPIEDWRKLLADNSAASAILDRLLHLGYLLKFEGKSYRQISPSFLRLRGNENTTSINAPLGQVLKIFRIYSVFKDKVNKLTVSSFFLKKISWIAFDHHKVDLPTGYAA